MEYMFIDKLDSEMLSLLKTGYCSRECYTVTREGDRTKQVFTVQLVQLTKPYVKTWEEGYTPEGLSYYQRIISGGWSVALKDQGLLAAMAICEPRLWNKTLWIWEFHVAPNYRRQGRGRELMDYLARRAKEEGFRIMVCEAQSTNIPALDFYRSVGFELDALDLTLYANNPGPQGEIAFYMKRKL